MKRPLAYLTAAWSGEPDVDMELAAHYCRLAYEAGFSPICPLLYLPLFLNDSVPEEHKAGIDMRRDKVLVDLRDERKGSLPVRCVCIPLMLRQFPCLWEAAEQTLDVLLLFLRDRKMGIVILEELHTFAGGEVAGTMGQPSGISAALHVWRDKYQPRHASSGSCRWTSWASSNLI